MVSPVGNNPFHSQSQCMAGCCQKHIRKIQIIDDGRLELVLILPILFNLLDITYVSPVEKFLLLYKMLEYSLEKLTPVFLH